MMIEYKSLRFFSRLRDASTERRNKAKTPEPGQAVPASKSETSKSKNVAAKNANNVRLSPVRILVCQ